MVMLDKKDNTDAVSYSITDTTSYHHVVATQNSSGCFFYVDNQLRDTGSCDAIGDTNEQVVMGGGALSVNNYDGALDEIGVWNRTLSLTEIQTVYKRGFSRLNITVRSCDDASCSGETFTDYTDTSPQTITESDNIYFQYRYNFTTTNPTYSPQLYNVTIDYDNIPIIISGITESVEHFNFTIDWNTNRVTNSTLEYGLTTGLGSSVTSASLVSSHSLSVTNLSSSTLYYYRLTSCDTGSCDTTAILNINTTMTHEPQNLIVSDYTDNWVKLEWEQVHPINNVTVYYSTDNSSWVTSGNTESTFFTVTGLTEDLEYYFRLIHSENGEFGIPVYTSQRTKTDEGFNNYSFLFAGLMFLFLISISLLMLWNAETAWFKTVMALATSILVMSAVRFSGWFIEITNPSQVELIDTMAHFFQWSVWGFRLTLIAAVFILLIIVLNIMFKTDKSKGFKREGWENW